jgi:predicted HTH transcriptional regulator
MPIELLLYRAGVDRCLEKPITAAQFRNEVNRVLERYRLGGVANQEDMDDDLYYLRYATELQELDYKKEIFTGDKTADKLAVASLSKDIIAFANSGGGRIIVGVAEQSNGMFEYSGIGDDRLPSYEVTKLNEQIKKYTGAVRVGVRVLSDADRRFVVIKVDEVTDTVAFAECEHQGAGLFEGRIYMRGQDARTAEVRNSIDATRMLQRLARRIAQGHPSLK